ncbi:MAG: GNAT family N-acetyltransferase [Candidatus Goldbacteria bacterium]|nr:GNAT family N-acetyltransferase [Candidatus Goldiibacteriota bacterium]
MVKQITDKEKIAEFLLNSPYVHLYKFMYMEPYMFPNTIWHASYDGGEIKALSLIYKGKEQSAFYLLEDNNKDNAAEILEAVIGTLPDKLYSHVTPGLEAPLEAKYKVTSKKMQHTMGINGDMLVNNCIKYPQYTYKVNERDFETLYEFIQKINPGLFFSREMMKTGKYYMIRKNSDIISTAGVHYLRPEYKIAGIGNVATTAEYRGKGYASSVVASLVRDLWDDYEYIGLNVKAGNEAALKAYGKIGFVSATMHNEIIMDK